MKRLVIMLLSLACVLAPLDYGLAQGCRPNALVREWLKERDKREILILRRWIKGVPIEDLAGDIAQLFYLEFQIATVCRKDPKFIRRHLHILTSDSPEPDVKLVPGILLEKIIGRPVLRPNFDLEMDQTEYQEVRP